MRVTPEAADLHAASHILLPGMGALGDAMAKLEARPGARTKKED